MIQDSWNRIRGGGPLAIAGLVVLLLAGVGFVLVLAGVRFPLQADRAPRVVLALLGLVLMLAYVGRLVVRQSTLDRPDQATIDGWLPLLLGSSLACVAAGLLLSHR
jgi:hypothetical protein